MKSSSKTVFELKNYGRINIKLKEILEAQCMSRNELATSIGCNFDVISRWYNNDVSRIDLDVLARACFVLNCNPDDLIQYEIQKDEPAEK